MLLSFASAAAVAPLACSSSNGAPPPIVDETDGSSAAPVDASANPPPHDASARDSSMMDSAPTPMPEASPVDSQAAATCSDGVKNGNETDVDCGGGTCPACGDNKQCKSPSDCVSRACTASGDAGAVGTCSPASCQDHIKNGTETDIDCGGGACPACLVGKRCNAPGDCKSSLCTNNTCLCPDGMVTMPTALALGGAYCIDAMEITRAEYNTFWTANPNLGNNLPPSCSFKQSYTPANEWPPTLGVGGNGGQPVAWVDWCDAYAYCAWKGKRLCGAIQGGPSSQSSSSDRLVDAWYNACSAEGANQWPYGQPYSAKACDGADYWASADGGLPTTWNDRNPSDAIDNTINTACQGGASGLYNMSGNVAEWEDACSANAGAADTCLIRGGAYDGASTDLRCDAAPSAARSTTAATIGFRCCL